MPTDPNDDFDELPDELEGDYQDDARHKIQRKRKRRRSTSNRKRYAIGSKWKHRARWLAPLFLFLGIFTYVVWPKQPINDGNSEVQALESNSSVLLKSSSKSALIKWANDEFKAVKTLAFPQQVESLELQLDIADQIEVRHSDQQQANIVRMPALSKLYSLNAGNGLDIEDCGERLKQCCEANITSKDPAIVRNAHFSLVAARGLDFKLNKDEASYLEFQSTLDSSLKSMNSDPIWADMIKRVILASDRSEELSAHAAGQLLTSDNPDVQNIGLELNSHRLLAEIDWEVFSSQVHAGHPKSILRLKNIIKAVAKDPNQAESLYIQILGMIERNSSKLDEMWELQPVLDMIQKSADEIVSAPVQQRLSRDVKHVSTRIKTLGNKVQIDPAAVPVKLPEDTAFLIVFLSLEEIDRTQRITKSELKRRQTFQKDYGIPPRKKLEKLNGPIVTRNEELKLIVVPTKPLADSQAKLFDDFPGLIFAKPQQEHSLLPNFPMEKSPYILLLDEKGIAINIAMELSDVETAILRYLRN